MYVHVHTIYVYVYMSITYILPSVLPLYRYYIRAKVPFLSSSLVQRPLLSLLHCYGLRHFLNFLRSCASFTTKPTWIFFLLIGNAHAVRWRRMYRCQRNKTRLHCLSAHGVVFLLPMNGMKYRLLKRFMSSSCMVLQFCGV